VNICDPIDDAQRPLWFIVISAGDTAAQTQAPMIA
jgi:hypothetical protein